MDVVGQIIFTKHFIKGKPRIILFIEDGVARSLGAYFKSTFIQTNNPYCAI